MSRSQAILRRWICAALLVGGGATAQASECANPRSAADSLFVHQRATSYDPAAAAGCFDLPPGAQGARTAVQLKQVLDARGLWVPVADLPDVADATDAQGRSQLQPMPHDFPQLVLVRGTDGQWRYSRETLLLVPDLYAQTFSPLSMWFQQALPPFFYRRFLGLHLWQFAYGGLLAVGALALGALVNVLLRGQISRMAHRIGLSADPTLAQGLQRPLTALIVSGVLTWGIRDLQLPIQLSHAAYVAVTLAASLAAVLLASRMVTLGASLAAGRAAQTESRLDDQAIPLLRQLAQLVVWAVGFLFVLQNNGVDVWSLVAGLGIGGLAVALAAQDTLANVFGSITIFIDKPFQVGDWVKVGDVEGTVEEVGFRSTRIRTFYNSLVTVPNRTLNSVNVDNMGLRKRRRVKITLGLTYDTPPDKVEAFVEGVRAVLAAHPAVERSYEVHLYDLGASAVEVLVYYHLVVPGWTEELEARAQNLHEFRRLAAALGVSFAFPSQSLYLESTPSEPLPKHEPDDLAALEATAAAFAPGGRLSRPAGAPFTQRWTVKDRTARGAAE